MILKLGASNFKTWVLPLSVVLLAFALRVYRLDFFSLRGDEAFTVIFVQRTWEGLWKGISTIEPNPPLMYLALRAWVAVAGASEFAARYFAVFFGVLGVPLLYRLAREMFTASVIARHKNQIALIAAFLIAINPYQIWHSQDVRNYTQWPALSLLALIFFWRWWRLELARPHLPFVIFNLSFYVLATLASLYTHYYDVFILAALNLCVFGWTIWDRRWRTLARWVAAQIVLVALYAPWVLFGTNRITTYGEASAEKSVPLLEQFSRTLATFALGDTVPDAWKTLAWLPLAFALILVLAWLARQDKMRATFFALWLAIPSLALYAISMGRPLFLERYLNGVAPAYYLAFALGINAILNSQHALRTTHYALRTTLAALTLLLFVGASTISLWNYHFEPGYAKAPDWRALMQFIQARQQPGDYVVQNFTEMAAIYYRDPSLPLTTVPKDYWATPDDEKLLRQLNQDYRRIWFIPAQPDWWDDARFVEKFLARTDERVLEQPVSAFRLQLYVTPREFEPQMLPAHWRVGNATLIGYRVEGARDLRVTLRWRADKKIESDLTVFVHLADAHNGVSAQHDGAPAFGLHPTHAWQPGEIIVDVHNLRVDAAPGAYGLIVGMYDPATQQRVPVFDANGKRLPEDRAPLAPMTIAP